MNRIYPMSLNNQSDLKWYLFLIINVFITVFLIFCSKYEYLPLDNHFIPDSTFYENHVFNEFSRVGLGSGFTQLNRLLYSLGPQSFLIYNTIIMAGSVYCCSVMSEFSPKAVSWAKLSIVFNPFLLISMLGPSKECNLTFLSMLAIYCFLKKPFGYKVFGIIVAVAALFIRAQVSACIIVSLLLYIVLVVYRKPINICLVVLVAYFVLNSVPLFNEIITNSQGEELEFFKESNIYEIALVLKEMSQNPVLQFPAFIAKTALIMFTPIARPNPLFANYIPLLDWGYTSLAMFMFPLNFSFLLLFIYQKRTSSSYLSIKGQFLIIYLFVGALSVIVSPNIQFRYLFPYIPILAGCYILHDSKIKDRIIIISSVIIITTFIITAIFFPKAWAVKSTLSPFFISWL